MCGGLGNQMFEYAYARALQRRLELPLCLDFSFFNISDNVVHTPRDVSALFRYNIEYDDMIFAWSDVHARYGPRYAQHERFARAFDGIERAFGPSGRFLAERFCASFENFLGVYLCEDRYIREFSSSRSAVMCSGYRQSERYFCDFSEDIRHELTLTDAIPFDLRSIYQRISGCSAVCVHVRRGDYTAPGVAEQHLVCTPKYYSDAAKYITSRVPGAVLFVFSDDIEWARANIFFESEVVFVEQGHPAHEDLRLMSACRHFVLSNSSFSWWAQYLSDGTDKLVCAPPHWFANGKKTDIYQSNWQLIDC